MSRGATSGEYDGWSVVFVAFLALNPVTTVALCDDVLSSCKIHKIFFHKSCRFWRASIRANSILYWPSVPSERVRDAPNHKYRRKQSAWPCLLILMPLDQFECQTRRCISRSVFEENLALWEEAVWRYVSCPKYPPKSIEHTGERCLRTELSFLSWNGHYQSQFLEIFRCFYRLKRSYVVQNEACLLRSPGPPWALCTIYKPAFFIKLIHHKPFITLLLSRPTKFHSQHKI